MKSNEESEQKPQQERRRKFVPLNDSIAEPNEGYAERRAQLSPLIVGIYKKLSPNEREVLSLLQQNMNEKEIAKALGISRRSVQVYRGRIKEKVRKLVVQEVDLGVEVRDDGNLRF